MERVISHQYVIIYNKSSLNLIWFTQEILIAIHLYPTLQKQIDRFNRGVVTPVEAKLRRQWLRFT